MNKKLIEILKRETMITPEEINDKFWNALLAVKQSDTAGELSVPEIEMAAVALVEVYYAARLNLK